MVKGVAMTGNIAGANGTEDATMRFLRVLLNFAHAFLFYPVMVGLFAWLYFTKAHWFWGSLVILAILVLDPLWRTLARSVILKWKNRP